MDVYLAPKMDLEMVPTWTDMDIMVGTRVRRHNEHKLDRIVAGDGLGEVIEALTAEDQAARLAELGE